MSITTAITDLVQHLGAVIQTIETTVAQCVSYKLPVGSLHLSTTSIDPGTQFGYGTWELYGQGHALVSAGNGVTANSTFGSDLKTIEVANLPAHTHGTGTLTASAEVAGDHSHAITERIGEVNNAVTGGQAWVTAGDTEGGPTGPNNAAIQPAGEHTHTVTLTGTTGSTGDGTPFDTRQASIGVYVWQRTA